MWSQGVNKIFRAGSAAVKLVAHQLEREPIVNAKLAEVAVAGARLVDHTRMLMPQAPLIARHQMQDDQAVLQRAVEEVAGPQRELEKATVRHSRQLRTTHASLLSEMRQAAGGVSGWRLSDEEVAEALYAVLEQDWNFM